MMEEKKRFQAVSFPWSSSAISAESSFQTIYEGNINKIHKFFNLKLKDLGKALTMATWNARWLVFEIKFFVQQRN